KATPDYLIPSQFLPTDGGTIDYAGVDRWTYRALPRDGVNALFRDAGEGSEAPARATDFQGMGANMGLLPMTIVEYYNAALDHYFVSGLAPDIDALDSGRFVGWRRTGFTFNAYPVQYNGASPVCRFIIPPEHGDSHFFSASADECNSVLQKT